MAELNALDGPLAALEARMGTSAGMVAAFDSELARMQETMLLTGREVGTLSSSIGGGLRRAFDGLVFDGLKLSDALQMVARTMVDSVYSIAMRPVQNAFGGMLVEGINGLVGGIMPFAKGGAFSQGRVMPFAKGGLVSSPTMFPMRGGRGLMGEAGPEAILPLARGADGRLGVQAGGGGRPVTVVMNIQTPDVQGFARSQSQIAAQAARALSRGQRNR
ncbi:MAG: phage tail tape measure protein [Pseudomonadota bacterium]